MASSSSEAELKDKLLHRVGKKMETASLSPSQWSIYNVPQRLRKINETAYSPCIISVGPLHRNDGSLQVMEAYKYFYMQSIVERTQDPEKTKADICAAISSLEKEARANYAEKISHRDYELAEILLVDGCFILELFFRDRQPRLSERGVDPLIETEWMKGITDPEQTDSGPEPPESLSEYALHFFQPVLKFDDKLVKNNYGTNMHLLDLLRKCCGPSIPRKKPKSEDLMYVAGATKLKRAGIRLEPRQPHSTLSDMNFEDGVLAIPPLCVDDMTEPLFRNLIAFEQCHLDCEHKISSYASFMDSLINTPEDVELLEEKGIIKNYLGDSKSVSKLFNNLCKEIVVKPNFFQEQSEKIDEYYNSVYHRYKEILRSDYCPDPCRTIAFLAATTLLIISILQTVYTVAF
ncbi:hypothetical protein F0562_007451 [Nyssa sinensis]|uniref:Uncharacterized protein n=1 Tax=Nyssa sinensis TaxID=561372 RepID=A0A5J5A6N2_9ASTE|nr:hypothetical protein F0562_007451 [Nyssa sinensis]